MLMYVANGMHQTLSFQYRLPEYKTYRQQKVPIGGQVRLSGDLNEKQIDIIAQFHQKYGMVKATDIHMFKGYFIPYVYSVDNPVSSELIMELIIQNREYNRILGEKLRAEAAIAVNNMIETNAGEKLTSFEMEIMEKTDKNREEQPIGEKIVITRSKERGAPQDPREAKGPLGIITDFIRPKPTIKKAVF
jgi:hypothetical protein